MCFIHANKYFSKKCNLGVDNTILKLYYNDANRRMLIALGVVCLTFIITIVVFVTGYTQREKNWLDTLQRVGVTDGIHQQSDP